VYRFQRTEYPELFTQGAGLRRAPRALEFNRVAVFARLDAISRPKLLLPLCDESFPLADSFDCMISPLRGF